MSLAELAARLPEPKTLREWVISLAVLDVILSPEPQWRYFACDPTWAEGEEMASMQNGSGDEYSIVFSRAGVYIRGFDHESPVSPWAREPMAVARGLTDGVPDPLRRFVTEPAFSLEGVPSITVCGWREPSADRWSFGEVTEADLRGEDGGASWLFAELDGQASTYKAFADEYYEADLPVAAVSAIFNRQRLTPALVAQLNLEAEFQAVAAEVAQLPY